MDLKRRAGHYHELLYLSGLKFGDQVTIDAAPPVPMVPMPDPICPAIPAAVT